MFPKNKSHGTWLSAQVKGPTSPTQQPGVAIFIALWNKLFPLPETLPSTAPAWLNPAQLSPHHLASTSSRKPTLTLKAKLGPLLSLVLQ